MSSNRPCVCEVCGRTEREAGRISRTAKCAACAEFILLESHRQIRERSGPYYEKWLRSSAEFLSGRILETEP